MLLQSNMSDIGSRGCFGQIDDVQLECACEQQKRSAGMERAL